MTGESSDGGFTAVALFARNDDTRSGLTGAIRRRELDLIDVTEDPRSFVDAVGPGVAVRVPGGLAWGALRSGAPLQLSGPSPQWFVDLNPALGRSWRLVDADGARALLDEGPAFVKLADAKHQRFPAARFSDSAELDAVFEIDLND